ncbi:MAG: hypothetical protein CMM47_00780 [Rhodospirillaceae bacterium]|nr:hypothetical protein [Rhodospirillaceae bacterium]
MQRSVSRVQAAAKAVGVTIEIVTMADPTRTAEEAAQACGCAVGQIVKSLIFQGQESGGLKLFLVSGDNQLDTALAAALVGEALDRADARLVRDVTGFAIGGVAPIGHQASLPTWIDETLLMFSTVWAAAGTPHTVFAVDPKILMTLTGGTVTRLAERTSGA